MALIFQNGDIYEDQLGPKYKALKDYWLKPTKRHRSKIANAISEEGFKDEFLNEVGAKLAEHLPP